MGEQKRGGKGKQRKERDNKTKRPREYKREGRGQRQINKFTTRGKQEKIRNY